MQRRKFIKTVGAGFVGSAFLTLSHSGQEGLSAQSSPPDAVWVENGEPEELLSKTLAYLGGITAFISQGDIVVIKPNIGWDSAPAYAANTNPDIVKALVLECYNAGAKVVKIFDRTCNDPRRCYHNSQIEQKAREAEADVSQIRRNRFIKMTIKNGVLIKEWPIYRDYLEADKVINIPIAKHHNLDNVTLGLKNLMGVMGGDRGSLHESFSQKLIDIDTELLPELTIIDAYRILTANGPRGGNLSDVKLSKVLIASRCTVTADFLALDLFGQSLDTVGHIKEAVNRGLNKFDIENINLKKVVLS